MSVQEYFDFFCVLWFPVLFLSVSVGAGFAAGAWIALAVLDGFVGSKKRDREKKAISIMKDSLRNYSNIALSLQSIQDSLRSIANIAIEIHYSDEEGETTDEVDDTSSTTTVAGSAAPETIVTSL